MRSNKWLLPVFVLLIASLACSIPGQSPAQPTPMQDTPQDQPVGQSPTDTVEPPASPTDTAEPPTATPQPDFCFEGVCFDYDAALGQPWGAVIPAEPVADGDPTWMGHPEYIEIKFNNYIRGETFHEAAIRVYSVAAYRQFSPIVDEEFMNFHSFIQQKPQDQENLPFLPNWPAAQAFHAQMKYVSFQNGEGVRYFTEYTQYFVPVNNDELFYTFQGMTADGQWYVSMVLPVGHPMLPVDSNAVPQEQMDAMSQDYEPYITDMVNQLNSQPDNSYVPGLQLLDELVTTLRIK